MNSEDLRQVLLVNNVDIEDVDLLYAEKLDGTSLPYVTEEMLLRMGLRIGPSLKILEIFRHIMAENQASNAPIITGVGTLEARPKRSASFADLTNEIEGSDFIKSRNLLQVLRDSTKEGVPAVIEELEGGKVIEDSHLSLLIRVLVDDLLARCGNYPPTGCKEALAVNVVNTWPQLKQKSNPNRCAHWLLFNRDSSNVPGRRKNGGKIENRIDTLMRRLPPQERRYNKRSKTVNLELDVEVEPLENSANLQSITEYMENTFGVRNQLRKGKISAAELLKRFPTLFQFKGDMIDLEFRLLAMHDRIDVHETVMEGLLPKIIAKSKIDFNVSDLRLKGILSLVASVPRSKKKQVMVSDDLIGWVANGLIHWIHVEDDFQEFVQTAKRTQPYLLCVTEAPSSHADGTFHVIVDGSSLDVGSSVVRGLEILYKTYHTLNLQYPPDHKSFFSFLDLYIFRYKLAKPSGPMEKFFKSLN